MRSDSCVPRKMESGSVGVIFTLCITVTADFSVERLTGGDAGSFMRGLLRHKVWPRISRNMLPKPDFCALRFAMETSNELCSVFALSCNPSWSMVIPQETSVAWTWKLPDGVCEVECSFWRGWEMIHHLSSFLVGLDSESKVTV